MDIKILSSLEKVFLDEAPNSIELTSSTALKGERFSFQIALYQEEECRIFFSAKATSKLPCEIEIFDVAPVPVTFPCYPAHDDNLLRTSVGLYPDIIKPIDANNLQQVAGSWKTIWITMQLPEDMEAGDYPIDISFTDIVEDKKITSTTFNLKVIDAVLPKQSIIFTQWFYVDCLASYYKCDVYSERHWEIIEAFMKNATKFGINMIFVPVLTPALDTEIRKERPTTQLVDITLKDGKYSFNFSKLERYIKTALKLGFKYFEINHLFTQWGALHTPKVIANVDGEEKRIFGWDTDYNDPKYIDFLNQLLSALKKELREYGVFENCFFHISDEPSEKSIDVYRESVKNLENALSDCKTIDALSDYNFFKSGLVKHPIPSTMKIEPFVENKVEDLWTYYCCMEWDLVSNHFIAFPGSRTRILSAALFKYNIKGFLHWGFNFYYSQLSKTLIDPFAETSAINAFPAGDPFIVYPGADGQPISSMRQYHMLEVMQDLRAMQLLESLAGYDTVLKIIEMYGEITFKKYPKGTEKLLTIREAINKAIEEYSL